MSPQTDAAIERRNATVETWLWLVKAIAKNVMQSLPPCFEYDDLFQAGTLGLIDAATKYDETRGVPFRAYATLRIRGEMVESARRKRYKEATHLPILPEVLEMPDASVEAVEQSIEHGQRAKLVAAAVEGLADHEQRVIEIYYRQDRKLAGIGQEFGVRQSRSSQILQMTRESLYQQLHWRGVTVDIETGCTAEEMSDEAYEARQAKRGKGRKACA